MSWDSVMSSVRAPYVSIDVGGGGDFAIFDAGDVRLVSADQLCQLRLAGSLGLAGKSALKCGALENLGGAVLLINSNWSRSATLASPKGKDGDDIRCVTHCKI